MATSNHARRGADSHSPTQPTSRSAKQETPAAKRPAAGQAVQWGSDLDELAEAAARETKQNKSALVQSLYGDAPQTGSGDLFGGFFGGEREKPQAPQKQQSGAAPVQEDSDSDELAKAAAREMRQRKSPLLRSNTEPTRGDRDDRGGRRASLAREDRDNRGDRRTSMTTSNHAKRGEDSHSSTQTQSRLSERCSTLTPFGYVKRKSALVQALYGDAKQTGSDELFGGYFGGAPETVQGPPKHLAGAPQQLEEPVEGPEYAGRSATVPWEHDLPPQPTGNEQ